MIEQLISEESIEDAIGRSLRSGGPRHIGDLENHLLEDVERQFCERFRRIAMRMLDRGDLDLDRYLQLKWRGDSREKSVT